MRVVNLDNNSLNSYIEDLATQERKLVEILTEIAIYSNGAISLQDLYNLPFEQVNHIEKTLSEKIKMDRNISGKEYL